jgi:hypothetical protein
VTESFTSNCMRNRTALVQNWRIHLVFLVSLCNCSASVRLQSRLWSGSVHQIPVQRYTLSHFQVHLVL